MQLLRHGIVTINGLTGQRASIKRRLDIRMHLLPVSTGLGYEPSSIGLRASLTVPRPAVTIRASGGKYETFRLNFSVAAAGSAGIWS